MTLLVPMLLALAVACFLVPAWVYVGYPAMLALIRGLLPREASPPRSAAGRAPTVSIVLPAHDEERVLPEKLANVLAARGIEGAEIVVASDGSSDRTVEIARAWSLTHPQVRVLDLPRVGKARALDAAAQATSGDILVFSDANALWEPGSLESILAPFADPAVGGVAGVQLYRKRQGHRDSAGEGESTYWRWDTWLKQMESDIGSCYGADGSLYAIRREAYVPIADPAQADDMAISMRVVTGGRRLVLAADAVAWEEAPGDPLKEFSRKIRVTNHSLRSLLLLGPSLWTSGFYSVVLISHKLLRHLTPIFLVAGLALTLILAPISHAARLLLVPQALVYGLGAAGWMLRESPAGRWKPLLVPYYFCLANAAALVGSLRALTGRRITSWTHDRKAPQG